MKEKKVKTTDGKIIRQLIPETEEEAQKIREEHGKAVGRHSFADGRGKPLDVDQLEGDPELGGANVDESKGS